MIRRNDANGGGEPMISTTNMTQARLILLYLINRMPYGAAHEEIVGLNMEHQWMLYFDLEQQLLELCDDQLLKTTCHDQEQYYYISADGMEIVELYKKRIPLSIRTKIDDYTKTAIKRYPQQLEVSSRYEQNSAVDYTVYLKLLDYFQPLMELTISAATEQDAKNLCARFRRLGPEIFANALDLLSQEDNDEDL